MNGLLGPPQVDADLGKQRLQVRPEASDGSTRCANAQS